MKLLALLFLFTQLLYADPFGSGQVTDGILSQPASAGSGDQWSDVVNADIIPDADGTRDVGSSTYRFAEGHYDAAFCGYTSTLSASPASAGIFRLSNNETTCWRNAADSADICLKVDASNEFNFGSSGGLTQAELGYLADGINSSEITDDSIVNADVNSSAAIAYSKLNLSGSITNSDINGSAAITVSKLAALTASRALETNGGGQIQASAVTATELNYLDGVTSAIQTQLDGKAPSDGDGIVDQICGHIETPSDKAYWLVINSSFPFTINSITTDVDSGTANGALEIDGTPVTGCTSTDISISTTEVTDTCSSGNTVLSGNDVEFVISSNSSADDLRFCLNITRD